jgi:hypothetical protein
MHGLMNVKQQLQSNIFSPEYREVLEDEVRRHN